MVKCKMFIVNNVYLFVLVLRLREKFLNGKCLYLLINIRGYFISWRKNFIYLLLFICMFYFFNFEVITEDVKMGIKNLRIYLIREKV